LKKGEETLKQGLNDPYTVEDQVALSMLVQKSIEKCSCEQSERI
jgi:hypothetical protein